MWQKLYEELQDRDFMIIAVAMDSRGESAVRGPIVKAKTTYVSLIDRDHVVAELYNMVNVPQAVWIDEAGRIVRPTEVSGATLSFNLRKMRRTRAIYLDAIRDWVSKGAASEYVFSHDEAGVFVDRVTDLLEFLIPAYQAEGKSYLTIGIGCTGGRHRSVAIADEFGERLRADGVEVTVHHRDAGLGEDDAHRH